jgi:hypothetical protein
VNGNARTCQAPTTRCARGEYPDHAPATNKSDTARRTQPSGLSANQVPCCPSTHSTHTHTHVCVCTTECSVVSRPVQVPLPHSHTHTYTHTQQPSLWTQGIRCSWMHLLVRTCRSPVPEGTALLSQQAFRLCQAERAVMSTTTAAATTTCAGTCADTRPNVPAAPAARAQSAQPPSLEMEHTH